jgi:uncharacterized LabA/DUF88 family protein
MAEKVALLLDGGFVKKKLVANAKAATKNKTRPFVTAADIMAFCGGLMEHARLSDKELFRIYYYDAPPYDGESKNPISGAPLNFSNTPEAARNRALIDSLELQADLAVRRGTIVMTGWKLGRSALKSLSTQPRPVTASDFVPDMAQKGVDLRIGLDIAWISVKRMVDVLVLVTGDSDFVPAMKFARKEGLRVYVATMGHPVRRELKAHADFLL